MCENVPQSFSLALPPLLESVTALINDEKPGIAANLRSASRSRLARLVLTLPKAESVQLAEIAARDLPVAARALALASTSSSINLVQEGRFADAVRAADVAMVLLGMPLAAPLRDLVDLVDAHRLAQCGEVFPEDDRIGIERIAYKEVEMRGLAEQCLEVEAKDLSLEQFRELFRRDEPVVIRGCAAHWPALRKWQSARYLGSRHGHRIVPVEWTAAGSNRMEEKFCALGAVLRLMLQPPINAKESVYLAQHPLFDYIPALEEDIEHPRYMAIVGKRKADLTNVWMGTAGSGSKLHYDSADNLLVQVVGEKKVVLIPVEESNLLHKKSPSDNSSPIDVQYPDFNKYPLFENVKGATTLLGPGDALYIPALHWHWVKAFTASISVNFWF